MTETTQWLASVQSLSEARQLAACLPDMLDMKQPAAGALGALPVQDVKTIVDWSVGQCLTSATIGDLPMQPETLKTALKLMQQSGVDYLKVGIFNHHDLPATLAVLDSFLTTFSTPVIAVVFADDLPSELVLTQLYSSNFSGVMIDTVNKNGQQLLDHLAPDFLLEFIQQVHLHDKLCGLAGALNIADIPLLQSLGADYLGFRSALCPARQRQQQLDPALAMRVRDKLRSASTGHSAGVSKRAVNRGGDQLCDQRPDQQ